MKIDSPRYNYIRKNYSPAYNYVMTVKNKDKKNYAEKYFLYLVKESNKPEIPENLCFMTISYVQHRLEELISYN